jgi:tRNA1Val (adenine37-N6)-methyltransferase
LYSRTKNSGFAFKQFYVEHQHCAMKVGTDSILLGSWTDVGEVKRVLDIGTGSGLLALMLAQKSSAQTQIVGIDIDTKAVHQAKINAENCRWSSRLSFIQSPLQSFYPDAKFDLIVSNPPYFAARPARHKEVAEDITPQRQQARHTIELGHAELLVNVARLLSVDGSFYCVLPQVESEAFILHAPMANLHCQSQLRVRSKSAGKVIRHLLKFGFAQQSTEMEELVIHAEGQSYSREYKDLCKDYYLNF